VAKNMAANGVSRKFSVDFRRLKIRRRIQITDYGGGGGG